MQTVVYAGDKIKHLRDARALTQEELAKKAGITVALASSVIMPSHGPQRDASSPRHSEWIPPS
jgi:transcriptional regulator with XRE-family HTH domain